MATKTKRKARTRAADWTRLTDEELLDVRFCDLGLRIEGTPLEQRIELLHEELARRDLRFRPHSWLSEEWFSPDGVPGIALPFYLAHPRLAKLEKRQMFEVEGGTDRWCMQLLRHEAGHAIDSAFRLHRRKKWQQHFGRFSKPYPEHYTPRPQSRKYVLHLDWWYAQSHPAEDFAETFAVWLRPRTQWRKRYAGWPALKKLEYVDELMGDIAGKRPAVRSRERVEPLSTNRRTLREHYEKKRQHYKGEIPEVYDRDLRRLFAERKNGTRGNMSAAGFLRKIRPEVCHFCARGTGEHAYAVSQFLQEMVVRCRELGLWVDRPHDEVKLEVAIFLSVQMVNYLHDAHHRIPM